MSRYNEPATHAHLNKLARQRYRLAQDLAEEKRRHQMAKEQLEGELRRMDNEISAFVKANNLFPSGERSFTTCIATYRHYAGTTELLGIKPNSAFPVYHPDRPRPREIFVKLSPPR